jgi:small GTP-binding protein
VQAYKVRQGEIISGSTPPGLAIRDKHLVPDENADAVRAVFEYYAFTGNLRNTLRYSARFGCFPTGQACLRQILQNRKYIGRYRDNDNFCEPIISEALFDDVQRKLAMNVKISQKRTYLFSGLVRCAIVGYTNAGKSTLLNALTGAGILAQDKLFATLDPTTRQYTLPSGMKLLLTDTVGFIRNLPHHLIKAFRSTLEEAALADVILHVCDASDDEFVSQLQVTRDLLVELGASGKPMLLVFNKCDRIAGGDRLAELKRAALEYDCESVFISAKTGEGLDEFRDTLERIAAEGRMRVQFLIPHSDGGALSQLYAGGHSVEVEYVAEGTLVTATVDAKLRGRFAAYRVDAAADSTAGEEEDDE